MDELKSLFNDLFVFVEELTKDFGQAISPSLDEIDTIKRSLISDKHPFPNHFYIVKKITGEIMFTHNLELFLDTDLSGGMSSFLINIQDGISGSHYLTEYLVWGKVAYLLFSEISSVDDIYKYSFKIRFPMRLKDGKIYWVLHEGFPLEIDHKKNVISHINRYKVEELYKCKKPIGLTGEFFKDGFYCDEWNHIYTENRYAVKPFILSAIQKNILHYFFNHPNASTKSCANELKYPLNTIKKYISDSQKKKGIIDKAKVSFPQLEIKTLKDVIKFLERIDWFNSDLSGYKFSR